MLNSSVFSIEASFNNFLFCWCFFVLTIQTICVFFFFCWHSINRVAKLQDSARRTVDVPVAFPARYTWWNAVKLKSTRQPRPPSSVPCLKPTGLVVCPDVQWTKLVVAYSVAVVATATLRHKWFGRLEFLPTYFRYDLRVLLCQSRTAAVAAAAAAVVVKSLFYVPSIISHVS